MAISFPIPFVKMSGTGNDFIIIDHREPLIPREEQPEFARKVCRRMFSVGADGLILLENSDDADFSWQFYNADGSVAEMCGNGARCAARFAHTHGIAGRKMRFATLAGIISAEIAEEQEQVQVELTPPTEFREALSITLGGEERRFSALNTGVPHAVMFSEEEDLPVKEWGRLVRYHDLFQPAGTNANFATLLDTGVLQVRTYERGVEDETRACGTGAVAAALIAAIEKRVSSPVEVVTSGGDHLQVGFELWEGPRIEKVVLTGPARAIYDGRLTAESLI